MYVCMYVCMYVHMGGESQRVRVCESITITHTRVIKVSIAGASESNHFITKLSKYLTYNIYTCVHAYMRTYVKLPQRGDQLYILQMNMKLNK